MNLLKYWFGYITCPYRTIKKSEYGENLSLTTALIIWFLIGGLMDGFVIALTGVNHNGNCFKFFGFGFIVEIDPLIRFPLLVQTILIAIGKLIGDMGFVLLPNLMVNILFKKNIKLVNWFKQYAYFFYLDFFLIPASILASNTSFKFVVIGTFMCACIMVWNVVMFLMGFKYIHKVTWDQAYLCFFVPYFTVMILLTVFLILLPVDVIKIEPLINLFYCSIGTY